MNPRVPMTLMNEERTLWSAWVRFWFEPTPLVGLHMLRILFGLVALLWLLPLAGEVEAFFGLAGWFDAQAIAETTALPESPIGRLSWSPIYFFGHDPTALQGAYWAGVVVLALFTLGFFTRFTGVMAWLVVITFTSNPLIATDAEVFLRLLSFYLMLGYLFAGLLDPVRSRLARILSPMDHWILQPSDHWHQFSSAGTTAVRLIQVHFALAVVTMALHKLQFAEWWSGISFWYPLTKPSELTVEAIATWTAQRGTYLTLLSLAAYGVLAWQLAFPFFAWRRGRARWILLVGAVIACIGLVTLYHQYVMGPLFLTLCLSYLTAEEWERILALLPRREGV